MNNKNKKWLLLTLTSALAAVGVHAYLALKYFQLKFGMAPGLSACNINATFNCDATTASSFSSLFGVPVALFGVSSHLILALMVLVAFFEFADRPEKYHRSSFLLSILNFLACLGMAGVSSFILHTYCLFCMATYLLSFLCLLGLYFSMETQPTWGSEIASYFTTDKTILGWLLAVPITGFIFNSMLSSQFGGENMNRIITEKVYQWASSPPQTFKLDQGLIMKTSENPKVTIVEFADYLCPHCKHAYPSLHSFVQSHSDTQLIFKSFPLDGICNPDPKMKDSKGDGVRCRLALSTICTEKLTQKGWDMHHQIYDHQEEFYTITSIKAADEKICQFSSANCTELVSCMDSPESLSLLQSQAQEGVNANISGTPSIFVNGKSLSGCQILSILEKAYEEAKK